MDTNKTEDFAVEAQAFAPLDMKVTTINGDELSVPKLSWGKELKLIQIIRKGMSELEDTMKPDAEGLNVVNIMTKILEVAPGHITEFVSLVLEQDEQWVQDNLDMPEIFGVIVPLLRTRLNLAQQKVQSYMPEANEAIQGQLQKLAQSTKKN